MQKIITAEDKEKKDKRNKIIIGVILIALMTLSSAGYAFFNNDKVSSNTDGKIIQNGVDFYDYNGLWQATISGQTFYFQYLPNETSTLKITKTLQDYSGKPLYFTENSMAGGEIERNIGRYAERVQLACLTGNCTENIPEKNCSSNVIIIQEKSSGSIVQQEDNCIYIFSNDSVREADAFVYKILGIK